MRSSNFVPGEKYAFKGVHGEKFTVLAVNITENTVTVENGDGKITADADWIRQQDIVKLS